MRKSNKIGQKSCIDISRYKYIPPSKLMKVKIHTKNNQNLQMLSLIDHNQQQQSNISFKINAGKEEYHQKYLINQNKILLQDKQNKLFRSISNPKLNTSNSKNMVLGKYHQKINNKKQQQHLQKLTLFIAQLQSKQEIRNCQLAQLKQEKKVLNDKLDRLHLTLTQKNKQIAQLHNKITAIQIQNKQKYQEYILLIQSLSNPQHNIEKVIQSQVQKISSLTIKSIKINSKQPKNSDTSFQFDQQQLSKYNQYHHQILSQLNQHHQKKTMQQLFHQQQQKYQMQYLWKDQCRNDNFFQTLSSSNNTQPQHIINQYKQFQYPTPNFGSRTPKQSLINPKISKSQAKTHHQQNNFLIQTNNNLQLSRIQETIQSDCSSPRRDNYREIQQYQQNICYSQFSDHQQLLQEIDQYLSKRVNCVSKK